VAEHASKRTWLQRGFGRLLRAVDPDAAAARDDVRAMRGALKEWRSRQEREAGEHGRRLGDVEASLDRLTREASGQRRDVARVRDLVGKQRDRLTHLLRQNAISQRSLDAEHRVMERLTRLARSPLPVIVGPWTGEVGFELLYWIPFLQWVRRTHPIDPGRLIAVSRGGVSAWYGHVTGQYEEIFRYAAPEQFHHATEERKKQHLIRPFDRQLVKQVMRARGIHRAHVLHPTLMYELFRSFWGYDATVKRLQAFTTYRLLPPVGDDAVGTAVPALPKDFVAVRFYFSSCFPDTPENRSFATRTIEGLAARTDVVLLNNDIVVDDHRDFAPAASARVHLLSAHMPPETNLALQTAIIRRARAFVGTYGGYSYLAPMNGVHSVAFYSRQTFKQHHLELAQRVFTRIGSARLMPVDVSQAGALALALAGADTTQAVP
jgi:hypothetical protein